jgi:phage shock protein E
MSDKQAKILITVIILVSLAIGVYLIAGSDTSKDTVTKAVDATITSNTEPLMMQQEMEGRILLDIRTPEEFSSGHLPLAENIDFYEQDFQARIQELDRNASYTLYCRSGNRTSQALRMMQAMGFTDVTELGGGVLAWQAAGGSLCRGC